MMTYAQARRFAQEASKSGSVLGLASIRALMSELNDVQQTLPIIHLAGTNGKGSVGAYLASIFCAAGLSVARYTSPAVFDPLEVFTYNGENITESEYAKVMSQVKDACDIMVSAGKECPTIFEIETAVAFLWFYEKKPDIVLLETGMGGATDATNLITHRRDRSSKSRNYKRKLSGLFRSAKAGGCTGTKGNSRREACRDYLRGWRKTSDSGRKAGDNGLFLLPGDRKRKRTYCL